MAKTRSAAKQARGSVRRHVHNNAILSRLHTLERKFLDSVGAKKNAEAVTVLSQLFSALDKAAKTQVIHPNNASRKKSRLAAKLKTKAA